MWLDSRYGLYLPLPVLLFHTTRMSSGYVDSDSMQLSDIEDTSAEIEPTAFSQAVGICYLLQLYVKEVSLTPLVARAESGFMECLGYSYQRIISLLATVSLGVTRLAVADP
jgi:hypothetical protein